MAYKRNGEPSGRDGGILFPLVAENGWPVEALWYGGENFVVDGLRAQPTDVRLAEVVGYLSQHRAPMAAALDEEREGWLRGKDKHAIQRDRILFLDVLFGLLGSRGALADDGFPICALQGATLLAMPDEDWRFMMRPTPTAGEVREIGTPVRLERVGAVVTGLDLEELLERLHYSLSGIADMRPREFQLLGELLDALRP